MKNTTRNMTGRIKPAAANLTLRASLRQVTGFVREQFISQLTFISRFTALLSLCIGSIAFFGWIYQNDLLKQVFITGSHTGHLAINTALSIVLLSFSLLLASYRKPNTFARFCRDFFAGIVCVIGIVTLCEYIFHITIGIDTFATIPFVKSVSANRIPINGSLIFVLLAISLLTIDRKFKNHWLAQLLALVAAIILLPTIIGYAYHIPFIYGIATNTQLTLPTTISCLFLIISILFVKPTHGPMAIVTEDSAGGFLARRLLLTSIFIPFIVGGIVHLGYRLSIYDSEFQFLLLIVFCVLVFTTLTWRNAQTLHRIDIARRQGERSILFLTEASKVLAASLDYKVTLRNVARLAVPYISDWCSIEIFDDKGKLQQVAIAHRDPKKVKWAREYRRANAPDMSTDTGAPHVLRTGKGIMYPVITDEMIAMSVKDQEELKLVRSIGMSALIIVPIIVQRKPIGVIQLVSAESGYHYTETDFAMAQELGVRASLAIENASLYQRSQEAIRVRDEFISVASHELKTPITSLKVYTQVLMKRLKQEKKDDSVAYLQKMDNQVNKLTNLVQDLLDVSRIQVGKLSFSLEEFLIDDLVKDIVDTIQPTAPEHKIQIVGTSGKTILADRDRLGQVLINLLTNAIKYSPQADHVLVQMTNHPKEVEISVRDFGIGIDKKHANRIFNRFYQVRDPKERTFPGLGMGLYISREIVRRHGGTLAVESEKGKGSTFHVFIPLKAII